MKVQIVLDSVSPTGARITTMCVRYWRAIHAERLRHRSLSCSAASSRAIPIDKVMEMVENEPAGPISWGQNQRGMAAGQELGEPELGRAKAHWQIASGAAILSAMYLQEVGCHKQIVNRVLEPFAWITEVITATDWENFFALRVEAGAQPEFQKLAFLMLKGLIRSKPVERTLHTPYADEENLAFEDRMKVSAARCARVTHVKQDVKKSIAEELEMANRLIANNHWSPTEHPAVAASGRHGNFTGWKQYRKHFPGENLTLDLQSRYEQYAALHPDWDQEEIA